MSYRITIVTPIVEWSRYKLQENERAIKQILSVEGAPNCTWTVEEIGVEPEKPKPPLILHCAPCKHEWTTEVFTACPKCAQRATVTRGALPEGLRPVKIEVRGAEDASETHNLAPPGAIPGPATTSFWECGKCFTVFSAVSRRTCPSCGDYVSVGRQGRKPKGPTGRPRGRPRKSLTPFVPEART